MSQRTRDTGRKYYVAVKRELKLKKPKHKKRGALDKNLAKLLKKIKKALEDSHHSENGSCGLQHTPNCI